jgi:hypothetical protein
VAKIRNVSTDTLEVRYAGSVLGVAEPDGLLDIPDEVAKTLEFPESLWSVVTPASLKKKGE